MPARAALPASPRSVEACTLAPPDARRTRPNRRGESPPRVWPTAATRPSQQIAQSPGDPPPRDPTKRKKAGRARAQSCSGAAPPGHLRAASLKHVGRLPNHAVHQRSGSPPSGLSATRPMCSLETGPAGRGQRCSAADRHRLPLRKRLVCGAAQQCLLLRAATWRTGDPVKSRNAFRQQRQIDKNVDNLARRIANATRVLPRTSTNLHIAAPVPPPMF